MYKVTYLQGKIKCRGNGGGEHPANRVNTNSHKNLKGDDF